MHFVQVGACNRIKKILASRPHVKFACNHSGSSSAMTGDYADEFHIIEFQLREIKPTSCTLSIRFSLCSYGTIDSIFISIVADILSELEADVWLMTSAIKQKSNYLPGDSRWLIAALPDEIAEMRKFWQNTFGTKQGAVRVSESFTFVGIIITDEFNPKKDT